MEKILSRKDKQTDHFAKIDWRWISVTLSKGCKNICKAALFTYGSLMNRCQVCTLFFWKAGIDAQLLISVKAQNIAPRWRRKNWAENYWMIPMDLDISRQVRNLKETTKRLKLQEMFRQKLLSSSVD